LGRFYKIWADIVGMSDCEELVGVTHRRWWSWFFGDTIKPKTIIWW